MKTKHARELRKGIKSARNLLWFYERRYDKRYLNAVYQAALKRSTYVSHKSFERTLKRAGMVN